MENLWEKIKDWFLNFLIRDKDTIKKLPEGNIESIKNNNDEVKLKNAKAFEKALASFENYALNLDNDIGKKVYNTIHERLETNKDNVEELLQLRKIPLSYEEIIEMYEEEIKDLRNYKKTIKTEKIDNFLLSTFYVPIGIIGIETNDSKNAIKNIFKAITTRNAIIILQEEVDKYSIEQLILIIVQEAFKKYNIDENIVQIVNKKEIEEDIERFDMYIKEDGTIIKKEYQDKMYIYQEDEYFEEEVKKEIERLSNKNVEIIRGVDINTAISLINKKENYAVSIYSRDGRKGYKFINMINSPNVFFNGTLLNAKENETDKNNYYIEKNILCENILNRAS